MDTFTLTLLVCSLVAGFLMAFSLGANDVSNAMGPAVGAKAITIRQAIVIASVLNLAGAVLLGAHVTATIGSGIIDASMITDPRIFMLGMFSALLAAGLWVLIATLTSLPVSSTHALVGAILGFGFIAGGPEVVKWGSLGYIILSWLIAPFFGGLVAYFVFVHIRKTITYSMHVVRGAIRWVPLWASLTVTMIVLSICFKTPLGKSWNLGWIHAVVIGGSIIALGLYCGRRYLSQKVQEDAEPEIAVEGMFRRLQVGTACYVALSQGANDVSNAIGPVVAIYIMARSYDGVVITEIPLWLLLMGGVGIAFGIIIFGHKVMNTIGERITQMTNTRGFAVDFSAATTILMAANMGMPISSTHATVGAVVGVGIARGFAAVDFRVLSKIFLYWMLTMPIAAISCIIIFQVLRWTFL